MKNLGKTGQKFEKEGRQQIGQNRSHEVRIARNIGATDTI